MYIMLDERFTMFVGNYYYVSFRLFFGRLPDSSTTSNERVWRFSAGRRSLMPVDRVLLGKLACFCGSYCTQDGRRYLRPRVPLFPSRNDKYRATIKLVLQIKRTRWPDVAACGGLGNGQVLDRNRTLEIYMCIFDCFVNIRIIFFFFLL